MDRVERVRQLVCQLNEDPATAQETRPLHEILAENREKQDLEFQQRFQERNVFHSLNSSDTQWLKKVKEKSQADEAELQRQIVQGLKTKTKSSSESPAIALPSGRVKKKKSSLIK